MTIDDYLRDLSLPRQVEALRSCLIHTERERDVALADALALKRELEEIRELLHQKANEAQDRILSQEREIRRLTRLLSPEADG